MSVFSRITPAWAGKRVSGWWTLSRQQDHPRVGGEKSFGLISCAYVRGSPPRGRGKGILRFVHHLFLRITPAWAGKSSRPGLLFEIPRDHPRVGGEKPGGPGYAYNDRGSPPRGRGKEPERFFGLVSYGITPAWAGKRSHRYHRMANQQDHPRVGGEKGGIRL